MKKYFCILVGSLIVTFAIGQVPTWAQDIAPVFYAHCTSCHHQGGLAPFSLLNFAEAVDKANAVDQAVGHKLMPPWRADPAYRHFAHERVLTAAEISAIHIWVIGGMPEGNIALAPSQPVYSNITQLSSIDFSFQIPTYTVAGAGDVHRNFPIPSGFATDRFLTAIEVIPGNPAIVHHVGVYQDTSNVVFQMDSADPGPGYSSIGLNSTSSAIVAYTPGDMPYYTPPGTGIRLFKNTNIIIQIHYPNGSQGMADSTRINLKFTSQPQREILMSVMPRKKNIFPGPINIPPNQVVTYSQKDTASADLTLLAVMPHMHLIGKTIKSRAIIPVTNDTIPIVSIPDWDFHWQGNYFFQNTLKIPAGTMFQAEASYDNTPNNLFNPNNPPQTVVQGNQTSDEMMVLFTSYMLYQPGDENIITDRKLRVKGAGVLCPGNLVMLEAIRGDNYAYQWYHNNSIIIGADSAAFPASQPGTYFTQISLGSNFILSDTITLGAGSSPSATISYSGSTALCEGDAIQLKADTGGSYIYQWFSGTLPIRGATLSSYTADTAGRYSVQVYGGCYAESAPVEVTSITCAGINEVGNQNIRVFPNPSEGNITIDCSSFHSQIRSIAIYDMQTRKVFEKTALTAQMLIISVDLTSPGCYILELKTKDSRSYKKLLIGNK